MYVRSAISYDCCQIRKTKNLIINSCLQSPNILTTHILFLSCGLSRKKEKEKLTSYVSSQVLPHGPWVGII